MKLTTTANVFVNVAYDPRAIVAELRAGNNEAVGRLTFAQWDEMGGWAKLGTATIEMEVDEKMAVEQVVTALREGLERERIATHSRQNAIIDQINRMTALEYSSTSLDVEDN